MESKSNQGSQFEGELGAGYDAVRLLSLATGTIGVIIVIASFFGLLIGSTRAASFFLLLQGGLIIGGAYVAAVLGRAILICRDILIRISTSTREE